MERRTLLKVGAISIASSFLTRKSLAMLPSYNAYTMPDESQTHIRTWMAFAANPDIWSRKQISEVKHNLTLIAATIANYEPVTMLVAPYDIEEADTMLAQHGDTQYPITFVEYEVDDLWLRDTGPTFVRDSLGNKVALDFNFNGWGDKQTHARDKQVAHLIANATGAEHIRTNLVLEGGCFEIDGHGTAIMTKSCIINQNRNPHLPFEQIELELKALLGLKKIIWLEGIKGKDITDGHTDFYARFVKPGEVLVSLDNYQDSHDYQVTRDNIAILQKSTDAANQPLTLHTLNTPEIINERYGTAEFAAGYIGYYVCNGAVIAQRFGDPKADAAAKTKLSQLFPNHVIEQIAIDGIASGGGSIHCATQQEILI